ncbi:MAG TPA: EF-P lysine aminoacylase GenX [Gammaproteobacteria bacterium]|nr:EF-P lysine aminoacylase GenX [Gammaproteobacteria bacterium]
MHKQAEPGNWQPVATLDMLRQRAQLLSDIRQFFAKLQIMEVETPILAHCASTEVHLDSFSTSLSRSSGQSLYLQTSPEYHMKRLLASGSGPIYQISHAFRREESGHLHNPEFTMLEWYRPDFDYHQLMDEMQIFLQYVGLPSAGFDQIRRISYADLFLQYVELNPHTSDISHIRRCAAALGIPIENADKLTDCDSWLDLILSHVIEPQLGQKEITFVYDYPATQASLARIRPGNPAIAERFEVYVRGIELANGFHELDDVAEQKKRLMQDQQRRRELRLDAYGLDQSFLAALAAGLPPCAGVALGVDRLLMLLNSVQTIDEVMAFPLARA